VPFDSHDIQHEQPDDQKGLLFSAQTKFILIDNPIIVDMKNDELCLVESAGQKACELQPIGEKPMEPAAFTAPGFDTSVILLESAVS